MTEPHWWLTKDGDVTCLALYERHYSARRYRDGRVRRLFAGPGQKIVLRTATGNAAWVWRKFTDDSGQVGINCAFFRNEGPIRSSLLVEQADAIADHCWPGERHYTYVDPTQLPGTNPGYCFLRAGWRRCGWTGSGKLVLERTIDMAQQPEHPHGQPPGQNPDWVPPGQGGTPPGQDPGHAPPGQQPHPDQGLPEQPEQPDAEPKERA